MAVFQGEQLFCVRGERLVFADLNFNLESGGCLTLIGRNGAGKSSLLRMMATLLMPRNGLMRWDGDNIRDDLEDHRARLHYVGHHDAIKPVLSVSENLKFWSALRNTDKASDDDFARALDVFQIKHLLNVPGRFLSAGQKRRVNLARILVSHAPIWLLDEPTTALDKQSIARLESLIEDHRAKGGMVVLSTHADMDLKDQDILDVGGFSSAQSVQSASLLAEGI